MGSALAVLLLVASCSSNPSTTETGQTLAEPTPIQATTDPSAAPPQEQPDAPKPEPVPYLPAGQPGMAQDYAALVSELQSLIPAELRGQVPWPDLRNPSPIVAQVQIFELWVWITANIPEPRLAEIMAAPGSESRTEIAAIFGEQKLLNQIETRNGADYQAFDHVVVTFESAGLPLWLSRDVPDDAVVVYYSDNSGPVDVTDRDSGDFLGQQPATPTRSWLSIMVPTNVGWLLWRDQLLDPSNGLEFPEVPPPPSNDDVEREPQV